MIHAQPRRTMIGQHAFRFCDDHLDQGNNARHLPISKPVSIGQQISHHRYSDKEQQTPQTKRNNTFECKCAALIQCCAIGCCQIAADRVCRHTA